MAYIAIKCKKSVRKKMQGMATNLFLVIIQLQVAIGRKRISTLKQHTEVTILIIIIRTQALCYNGHTYVSCTIQTILCMYLNIGIL